MYIGGIITLFASSFWSNDLTQIQSLHVGFILLIPGGVDGTTQMFGDRESNNFLRAVTGLFLGIGIVLVTYWMVFSTVNYVS